MASSKASQNTFKMHCTNCNSKMKKESRQLGCLHQFCLECVQVLARGTFGQKQLRCPACGEMTLLPLGLDAKDLPQPMAVPQYEQRVNNLAKIPQGDRGELNCDLCAPVKAHSHVYCLKCQKKLCHQCYHAHQTEKTLSLHETMPIVETVFCTQHPNQVITLFCDECKKGLCLKCVLQGHNKRHAKTNMQELAVTYRKEIKSNLEQQMMIHTKVKGMQEKVSMVRKDLAQSKVYSELDKQLDRLKESTIQAVTECVDSAKANIKSKREVLEEQMGKIDVILKSQVTLRKYAEDLAREALVIDILLRAKELNSLLNGATELPLDMEYPVCDNKIQVIGDKIRELLQNYQVPYKEAKLLTGKHAAVQATKDDKAIRSPDRTGAKPKTVTGGETNYPTVQKPVAKQTTLRRETAMNVGSEVTGLVFDMASHYLVIRTVEKKKPVQLYSLQWAMMSGWGGDVPGLAEGGQISVDIKRSLYLATTSDKILTINKAGKVISEMTNSHFKKGLKLKQASGIAYCTSNDQYIVSDTISNCIALIDPGTKKTTLKFGPKCSGTHLGSPTHISYDDCGAIPAIVVSDHANHCISVFTTQGTHVQSYGSQGAGDIQLQGPGGACVDLSGRLLVCDTGNQRVARFWTQAGKVLWECMLTQEQLGGGSPRDIALHPHRGLLAICVSFKHGEFKVFVYSGYL